MPLLVIWNKNTILRIRFVSVCLPAIVEVRSSWKTMSLLDSLLDEMQSMKDGRFERKTEELRKVAQKNGFKISIKNLQNLKISF